MPVAFLIIRAGGSISSRPVRSLERQSYSPYRALNISPYNQKAIFPANSALPFPYKDLGYDLVAGIALVSRRSKIAPASLEFGSNSISLTCLMLLLQ